MVEVEILGIAVHGYWDVLAYIFPISLFHTFTQRGANKETAQEFLHAGAEKFFSFTLFDGETLMDDRTAHEIEHLRVHLRIEWSQFAMLNCQLKDCG